MRKIYEEYFHIPEKGVLKEKVFYARIAVSVLCIVLCMAALGFNAYAFFSSEISSGNNVIKSASYDLNIVLQDENKNNIEKQPISIANGTTAYQLDAGTYVFVLQRKNPEQSASTGYAQIRVGADESPLYTEQIGVVSQTETIDTREVKIVLEEDATVQITPCWGTYSRPENGRDLIANNYILLYKESVLSKVDASSKQTTLQATNEVEATQPNTGASEETVPTETKSTEAEIKTENMIKQQETTTNTESVTE